MARDSDVPQPGPAKLTPNAGPDEWLEQAKLCRYLPEADMKRLCEIVKECLMEGKTDRSLSCFILNPCHATTYRARTPNTALRVKHTTRTNARDGMRRHTWPILRPPRALQRRRWYAGRHSFHVGHNYCSSKPPKGSIALAQSHIRGRP